jgi:hypothetical protein
MIIIDIEYEYLNLFDVKNDLLKLCQLRFVQTHHFKMFI